MVRVSVLSFASRVGAVMMVTAGCGVWSAPTLADPNPPQSCLPGDALARVEVPGGTFRMGSNVAYPEEAPVRAVTVAAFSMDAHEVTNAQFARFVAETGYVTQAERGPDPANHPEIPPEMLVPGSAVFVPPLTSGSAYWWRLVEGASWRAPEGPGSSVDDRANHPVVHMTHADALAYAAWAGGDLPTEAEWEFAARAGRDQAMYEWGDTPPDAQTPARANTWQGAFPLQNTQADGFARAAPAGCFAPNAYGLYDMTGNVWELVKGAGSLPGSGLMKGGSFLCAPNFCRRYRPAARHDQEADFSASHVGFRLVYRGA